MWLKKTIIQKKAALTKLVKSELKDLAEACAEAWPDPDRIDEILQNGLTKIPNCRLIYALDKEWHQINSNVTPEKIEKEWRGQDFSGRPFVKGNLPYRGMILSSVYISKISLVHCITAIQAVVRDSLVGFIGADFNLDDIPEFEIGEKVTEDKAQYKGDPSIRGQVFNQTRSKSLMDTHIDEVIYILDTLYSEHGLFHCILHFSSSRFVVWAYDDPYNYRLHSLDEILDSEIWLAYPSRPYPAKAKVPREMIRRVLETFRKLREADDNIYLRIGSLNIMNGLVGLTFSCDGSHYMQVEEFLEKDMGYWF